MARSWYIFIDGTDSSLVSSYIKIPDGKHICLCGDKLCAIYATGTGHIPEDPLSPNMLQYIKAALTTGQLQPETPFYARKYVYLKY